MSDLFEGHVFESRPSKRVSYRDEIERLKREHQIWTHKSEDWMALCIPKCHKAVDAYGLTPEERSDPIAMIASYGGFLEDDGLIADGFKTELDAVREVVARITNGSKV